MSAQANIVAYDGAATPVSHTLVAIGVSVDSKTGETVALYREGITTLPIYAQVSMELRQKKLPSGVYRVQRTTEVPVMESVSGQNAAGYTAAPKVAYVNKYVDIGFFHERSTIADRRLGRQLHVNIGNGVATSVAPTTAGNVPELIDSLVFPS